AIAAEMDHEVFGPEGPLAVEKAPDKRQDTARALAALPNQGMQRVEAHPEHPLSMIITVDADRQVYEPLTDRRMYLAVTSALNHEDPAVAELVRRALAGEANHAPATDDEAE